MIDRIKALVAAGLSVQMYNLAPVSPTKFAVNIYDAPSSGAVPVCTEYDWLYEGSVDATLEAAVSKAEAYLTNKSDEVKGAA